MVGEAERERVLAELRSLPPLPDYLTRKGEPCSVCHRLWIKPGPCGMVQPDGSICQGVIPEPPEPRP